MTEALRGLLAEAETKTGRANVILAKESLGDAEVLELTALNSELEVIRVRAEQLKSLEGNTSAITGMVETPEQKMRHATGGTQVLGNVNAGTTQIDLSTGAMEHDDGAGFMKVKQFQAINTVQYRDAFRHYIEVGGQERRLPDAEQKALTEGLDTGGGFLVPPMDLQSILSKAPAPTSLPAQVTTVNCNRDVLHIPKVNYTTDNIYSTGMRASWTGEVPTSSTAHRVTEPVFGMAEIPVYTCMASMPLSNDFIEDASIDVLGWINGKISEFMGLLDEDMIINGQGAVTSPANQPRGLVASTNSTVDTASFGLIKSTAIGASSAITALIEEMPFKLPEQYQANAKFLFNLANAGLKIFQIKDTQNRPYFGGGLYDMSQARDGWRQLMGFPSIISALMPNMGANTFPVYFGDFKGYYFVRRLGVSVQVLNEVYAETNQKCVLVRYRVGGAAAEEWRILAGKTPS